MGADSICIKDMAGLLLPSRANELIKELKKEIKIPLQLHSHCTSGVAPITYVRGIEAGCDGIDTALSPFSLGTSQPSTEVLMETYRDSEFDFGLNSEKLMEATSYFRKLKEKYIENGMLDPKVLETDISSLISQVPGGMIANLISQLKEQHAEHRFYEVLDEIPRVRAEMGEPPLVTPSSQIVGTQAVLNVLMGERYKVMSAETRGIFRGEYGKTTVELSKTIQQLAIGDETPLTCRPADLLEPELEKMESEIEHYKLQEEDVLTYTLFPKLALDYFKIRDSKINNIDLDSYDLQNKGYPV